MKLTMLGNDYQYAYAAQPSSVSSALGYSYTYGAIQNAVSQLGADDYGEGNWKWYRQNNTAGKGSMSPREAANTVANNNKGSKIGQAASWIGDLLDRGTNLITAIGTVKGSVATQEDKQAADEAGEEIGFLAGLTSDKYLPMIVGGVAVTGLLIFVATRKGKRRR